ncbi:BQ2448_6552 [Microbotryum intermedium]|uniref:BQ2448_6552 protein n=1 Tax=Microbotryum intermedium TaxID=269621 RepID=A0A238FK02_9BASI|nr:BQ2448_6552 [Microbotryum intermedium]
MAVTAVHKLTIQQQQQQHADIIARFHKELNFVNGPNAIHTTLSLATHKSFPRVEGVVSERDVARVHGVATAFGRVCRDEAGRGTGNIEKEKVNLGLEIDLLLFDVSGTSPGFIPADPTKGGIHAVHTGLSTVMLERLNWEQIYPDRTSIGSTLIASPRRAAPCEVEKGHRCCSNEPAVPHVLPELLRSNEVMVIPPTLLSLHPHG